jgi:hypothetical protein
MSVKVIRPHGSFDYSLNYKKVRIEFKDGSNMIGFINIHSKFVGGDMQDGDLGSYRSIDDSKFKFTRASDYLKDCNQNEGMITVFNAFYGGSEDKVCFVFLSSVKFITEENEIKPESEKKPQPQEEEQPQVKTGLFFRDRIKKNE